MDIHIRKCEAEALSTVITRKIAEIEIIDGCNAKCVCCPRGLGMLKSTFEIMPLDLYKKIIDKCKAIGITEIVLFNWSDPFTNKELYKYCKYAREQGLYVHLSSNLSFGKLDLERILKYTNSLLVSISGFNQETYVINHRGCDINKVKNNLIKINELKKQNLIHTTIEIRYFEYPYNMEEKNMWLDFIKDTDFKFEPVDGNENPIKNRENLSTNKDVSYFGVIANNTDELYNPSCRNVYCSFIRKLAIDIKGNLLLCSEKIYDKQFIIGNFLDEDIYQLQEKRLKHKECDYCLEFKNRAKILSNKEKIMLKKHKFL